MRTKRRKEERESGPEANAAGKRGNRESEREGGGRKGERERHAAKCMGGRRRRETQSDGGVGYQQLQKHVEPKLRVSRSR